MSDRPTDPLALTVELKAGAVSSSASSDGAPAAELRTGVLHVGGSTKEVIVPIPVQVPGYEIIEEIGRGGMGVVYKARQKGLNRVVALKMILAGSHAGDDDRARFRIEAEAVARLQHPNIVQVYEVDEYEGKPFLSLEYCPHGALDRKLGAKPLPPKEAAALVETLARAMQTAHDAGVIHRDLKPANILLVSGGVVSGEWSDTTTHTSPLTTHQPKITDFGLAKKLDVRDGTTRTGVVMGTPGYMAPEQARGDTREVGPAADVYSLGAILYECLTGRPPFVGATPVETIMQVLEQDPPPPRMLNRMVDPDLEKVTLKCLEKDPTDRYPNADALAEDLRRYQDGEPVTARSINLLERLQRELAHSQYDAQLRPWGTGLILLGAIILVAHLLTSLLLVAGVAEFICYWVPRIAVIALTVPLLLRYRPHSGLMPTNAVERLIWAVWIGYLIAFAALVWVMQRLGHGHLEVYGPGMVLSGLAWFVMGGHVWGGCYLIGLLFMAGAPTLTLLRGSPWSPFVFGIFWGVTLFLVGARYRRLGRAVGA
jgi:eukaryotic-like serine/threonine-protein kinase